MTDDESESKVIDVLQRHGIESPRESRRRMNLPPEMEEVDVMETVLANKQNAEEIGRSKEDIEDLAGGARDDIIAANERERNAPSLLSMQPKNISGIRVETTEEED